MQTGWVTPKWPGAGRIFDSETGELVAEVEGISIEQGAVLLKDDVALTVVGCIDRTGARTLDPEEAVVVIAGNALGSTFTLSLSMFTQDYVL